MSAVSHGSSEALSEKRRSRRDLLVPEMWASLAISVIWLSVLFDAILGPDIVVTQAAPGSMTRLPSAVVVALFAYLATRVVARYGFRRAGEPSS